MPQFHQQLIHHQYIAQEMFFPEYKGMDQPLQ